MIIRADFYTKVLQKLGLQRYLDVPDEAARLDNFLRKIGALAADSQSLGQNRKFIRLEVLISAMRIHRYEYAGLNLTTTKLQGVDFRTLSPKSSRILNRLARLCVQYQDKYQQRADIGVKITMQ